MNRIHRIHHVTKYDEKYNASASAFTELGIISTTCKKEIFVLTRLYDVKPELKARSAITRVKRIFSNNYLLIVFYMRSDRKVSFNDSGIRMTYSFLKLLVMIFTNFCQCMMQRSHSSQNSLNT